MTPLTREQRESVIRAHPAAAPGAIQADLDEYEALVAAQFAKDPSTRSAPQPAGVLESLAVADPVQARLAELHAKLFR